MTQALQQQKLQKVCKIFLLASITNELVSTLVLKIFYLLNEKKFRKAILCFKCLCDSCAFAKLFFSALGIFYEIGSGFKGRILKFRF